MANNNFWVDFPIARETEKEVVGILIEKGFKFIGECDNSDYDLLMETVDGRKVTIEVKEDFTCQKTGNIGVEFECRGKPSGISVSKAMIYLYKIHQPDGKIRFYCIPTTDLKDMIKNKVYHRIVSGGDPGSNSMNYLFRLDIVRKYFTLVR